MAGWCPAHRVGNIYVYFKGALCLGPDRAVMISTMVLIVVCSLLFVICTKILGARILCGCISLTTLWLTARCGMMDPGVCPQAPPPLESATPCEPPMEEVLYIDESGRQQRAFVERKWCYCCNNYRPLRAVHCRFCDVCVARRDHHCPWVGTCVGERNYKYYFFFLWSTLSLSLTVMIGGVWGLSERVKFMSRDASHARENAFLAALRDTYFVEPLLVLTAFIAFCLVAPLAAFHTILVTRNMTTVEEMRLDVGQAHYYNHGSWWRNMKAALFSPVPPSNLDQVTAQCASNVEIVVECVDAEEIVDK